MWKILDGIGDTIDGTAEEISDFLFQRLVKQGQEEVGNKIKKTVKNTPGTMGGPGGRDLMLAVKSRKFAQKSAFVNKTY